MNKTEIWNQLIERYPEWKDPEHVVKLKSKGLKALIDQAYECGVERGKAAQKALNELENMGKKDDSLFGKIFGKGL